MVVSGAFGSGIRADEKADKLVQEVTAKSATLRTLSGRVTIFQVADGKRVASSGTFYLKKPNRALITLKGGPLAMTLASDGVSMTTCFGNQYMKTTADPRGKNINVGWAYPITMFFDPVGAMLQMGKGDRSLGATETIDGLACSTVLFRDGDNSVKIYVGPDRVLRHALMEMKQGDKKYSLGADLADVRINAPVTAAQLAFNLPKNAKKYEQPDYNAKLIAVGKFAEKFDMAALDQDRLTFDDAARGKRAVLVNFWFYG